MDVQGTLAINGTLGTDTLDVQRKGISLLKVRGSKDTEITGGFFMKHQLVSGTIATFTDGTLGANAGTFNATAAAYDPSATFTATILVYLNLRVLMLHLMSQLMLMVQSPLSLLTMVVKIMKIER